MKRSEEIAILSDNLRYLRTFQNETLEALSELTDTPLDSLYALEQGVLDHTFSIEHLAKLCAHYRVRPGDMLLVRFRDLS